MPPRKPTSNARHWCEFCRVYVFNNTISKRNHDESPQHKAALSRFISKSRREEVEQEKLLKDYQARTGVIFQSKATNEPSAKSSFYTTAATKSAPRVESLSMKGVILPAKRAKTSTAPLGAIATEKISAKVGQWKPIINDPSETLAESEEVKEESSEWEEDQVDAKFIKSDSDSKESKSEQSPDIPIKLGLKPRNKPTSLRK